jgi:Tfp pilus assembly protein PilO
MKLDMKLGSMTQNSKYALFFLGTFLIFVLTLILVVQPLHADNTKNSDALMLKRQKLAAYQTFAQQHADYPSFETSQRLKVQKEQLRLPDQMSVSDTLRDYSHKAEQSGIQLVSVKTPATGNIKQQDGAFPFPLTIKVTGNYFKIVDFLQRVENGDRYAKLQQVVISGNETNGDLTVDSQLTVYSMKKDLKTFSASTAGSNKTGVDLVKERDAANRKIIDQAQK